METCFLYSSNHESGNFEWRTTVHIARPILFKFDMLAYFYFILPLFKFFDHYKFVIYLLYGINNNIFIFQNRLEQFYFNLVNHNR